jgi:hypothetical protein
MENPYGGSIIMLNVAIIGTGNISPNRRVEQGE